MKKILILAVAATALVACAKSFDKSTSEGQAIGFGTWTERLTKHTQGLSTGDTGFQWNDGNKFTVVGYKTNLDNSKTPIFDNVEVTYTESTDSWAYETPRYWDYSATNYVFHALAPSKVPNPAGSGDPVATASLVVNTGATSAASAAITFAGNDSDILVASETTITNSSTPHYGQDVNLAFNHIASLVDLKVKKDSQLNDAVVDITSVSITTMGNKGTFQIGSYSPAPNVTWSTPSSYTGTYTNTSGVTPVATLPTNISSELDSASDLISKLIVLPQDFNSTGDNIQKIVISYKITDKNGTPDVTTDDIVSTFTDKEIPLHLFDKTNDRDNTATFVGSFAAGTHYTFILTINATVITFTASVNGWTDEANAYGYLIN